MEQRRPAPMPCDQCRKRKVKCSYSTPFCNRCLSSSLTCTYTSVRKKRGPKTGKGVVVDQLRAQQAQAAAAAAAAASGATGHSRPQLSPVSGCQALSIEQLVNNPIPEADWGQSDETFPNSYFSFNEFTQSVFGQFPAKTEDTTWRPQSLTHESPGPATPDVDTYSSPISHIVSVSLTPSANEPFEANDLVLQGVKLFFEYLYPVYPVLAKGQLDGILGNPANASSSEACLVWSICGMTLMQVDRWPGLSLEQRVSATRKFVRRCKEARLDVDFTETATFYDVLCSLFIGMALFEMKCRKASWFYVREAITLSFPAGLQQAEHDVSLEYDERLRRKRTYALLFITERGAYEDPSIAAGLQGLYNLFSTLDFNFVRLWNDSSRFMSVDKGYPELCALQDHLRQPMDMGGINDIQRADVLITQQWLRLVFWQAALRGGLISTAATHHAFTYEFPLEIASSLCEIVRSLPPIAIQVHGLGIFEKQFEIAYSLLDALNLSGTAQPAEHHENLRYLLLSLSASPSSRQIYVKTLERKMGDSGPRKYRNLAGVQLLRDDNDSRSASRRHSMAAGATEPSNRR